MGEIGYGLNGVWDVLEEIRGSNLMYVVYIELYVFPEKGKEEKIKRSINYSS